MIETSNVEHRTPHVPSRLATWLTDRANPILVRSVRQELRNRTFVGIFLVLLTVAGISAVVTAGIAGSEDRNPQAGRGLFGVLAWAWCFVVVVQSLGTFRAVVLERNEDTWDLVDLTGMGPRRILRGLLMANLVQAQLYAAALAPFMAMAYLLRGLDLFSIAFALIAVPLAGVAGSTCAVMLASLGTNKASRGFLGGVLGLGLLILWLMTFSFWFSTWGGGLEGLIEEIRRGGTDAWLGLGLAFNCWFAFVITMLVFAGALMAHRAANRSGGPRLLWLILWLNALTWFITMGWWDGHTGATSSHIGEALAAFTVFGVLWAMALGVFSVTEEFALSPRQARAITQPGRWRFTTLLLGPGAARGRLAFLMLTAASLIVGWFGASLSEHDWAQQTVNAGLVIACHGCFLIALGDWVCRRWFTAWIDTPVLRRGFILVLAACWCLVPVLAALVVNAQRLDQSFLAAISPVMAVVAVYDSSSNTRIDLALIVAGVVGIGSTAILLAQGIFRLRITTRRISARDNEPNPRSG